jgi:hypothetical protein
MLDRFVWVATWQVLCMAIDCQGRRARGTGISPISPNPNKYNPPARGTEQRSKYELGMLQDNVPPINPSM